MRTIKFRGKRQDNGAWETGSLVVERMYCHDARYYIADKMTGYHTPVDPATVGQFTGLSDVRGNEIYEGDIIYSSGDNDNYAVCYWQGMFLLEDRHEGDNDCLNEHNEYSKVVGNIHDNPELLEPKSK